MKYRARKYRKNNDFNGSVKVAVRPSNFAVSRVNGSGVSATQTSKLNELEIFGSIEEINLLGEFEQIVVRAGNQQSIIARRKPEQDAFRLGEQIKVTCSAESLVVMPN